MSSARSPRVGMSILLRDSCESSWGEWLCRLVPRKGERQPVGSPAGQAEGSGIQDRAMKALRGGPSLHI